MKKNIWFLSLPVCVLALGILCASCNTSTNPKPEPDTWSPVDSLDQLDGKWKGSYKQTIAIKEIVDLLGQVDGEMDDDIGKLIAMLGDMKVTIFVELTSIINAEAKTTSGSATITLTFSDGNLNTTWVLLRPALEIYLPDAVFNDKNHSITMTQDIPEEEITDEDVEEMLASGVQINQNGKKIKIPVGTILDELPEEIPPGMIPSEIIMTKQ